MSGEKRYQGGFSISGGHVPDGEHTAREIVDILNRDSGTVGSFSLSDDASSFVWHRPTAWARRATWLPVARGQRRRERRRARAQQRRERLRESQLSQRRAGRVDGPRGRITGPGTYDLGGGVTVTFGEGTLAEPKAKGAKGT